MSCKDVSVMSQSAELVVLVPVERTNARQLCRRFLRVGWSGLQSAPSQLGAGGSSALFTQRQASRLPERKDNNQWLR